MRPVSTRGRGEKRSEIFFLSLLFSSFAIWIQPHKIRTRWKSESEFGVGVYVALRRQMIEFLQDASPGFFLSPSFTFDLYTWPRAFPGLLLFLF
jgi:hypothetical protein